jgi:hypothetical protein
MAAPTIYRSSDTNAPILTTAPGSLISVLNACLVNGYGSVKATATIHSDGTTVANGNTITIDGIVYTWKTALTPAAGEVLIGANAAANLSNLAAAISRYGTENTNYGTGTTQQTRLQVTNLTATDITLTAFVGGSGGNSIALSTTATHVTVPANFSGGSGSDSTASLGWGVPFTGTNKASYRPAAGIRHYLDIDDSGPDTTALGRNSQWRGYEAMTAVGTGTGQFPTTTQVSACVGILKSTTLDKTARPWLLIGDDRTFYLYTEAAGTDPPNLSTHTWTTMGGFGEALSALTGDLYRSIIYYFSSTSTVIAAAVNAWLARTWTGNSSATFMAMPRQYTGVGSAVWIGPLGNGSYTSSVTSYQIDSGPFTSVNPVDGGVYLNAVDLVERGTSTSASLAPTGIRGRARGSYQTMHTTALADDQTTFSGVGDFAGRTFILIKTTNGFIAHETTSWASSS